MLNERTRVQMDLMRLTLILFLLIVITACSKSSTGSEPDSEQISITGTISVEIITSGNDLNPPGFTVSIEGKSSSNITSGKKVFFDKIEPGNYKVELKDIASHCSVINENPQTAVVTPEKTISITFQVECIYTEESVSIPQIDNAADAFLDNYNAAGLSLAVTFNGKLVYVKSYGMADTENDIPVENTSLFRIASVSKPITGVTIMHLFENGLLSLDDKVFGEKGILGTKFGNKAYSEQLKSVTVKHLLHHTAGGWSIENPDRTDPMFTNPNMNKEELLSWTLDNYPLENTPGSTYAYSNFGYFVLGRIVEEVSSKSYEDYVKDEILTQMGITDMHIAGNKMEDRRSNEVKYYGGNPYGFNISRMDSHGGWIASAKELARFIVHVDGIETVPDILNSTTIEVMTTPSEVQNYAAGWSVSSSSEAWWHVGSLPGTAASIDRSSGGFNWIIICNSNPQNNSSIFQDMIGIVANAINNPNISWPEVDFFKSQ